MFFGETLIYMDDYSEVPSTYEHLCLCNCILKLSSSCNERGILRNLKIPSSDNHLKLPNLNCETFISITFTGRNVSQNKTSIPKDSNSSKSKNVQIFTDVHVKTPLKTLVYYINTSEIPSELSRENFISSHVKRSPSLWLH